MAVRGNALVWPVTGFAAFELVDVLADQVFISTAIPLPCALTFSGH
jgi:hypothetical protein